VGVVLKDIAMSEYKKSLAAGFFCAFLKPAEFFFRTGRNQKGDVP
jgi:hypothetical protein